MIRSGIDDSGITAKMAAFPVRRARNGQAARCPSRLPPLTGTTKSCTRPGVNTEGEIALSKVLDLPISRCRPSEDVVPFSECRNNLSAYINRVRGTQRARGGRLTMWQGRLDLAARARMPLPHRRMAARPPTREALVRKRWRSRRCCNGRDARCPGESSEQRLAVS